MNEPLNLDGNVLEIKERKQNMDKQQLKEREARVIELAVAFCNEHLDEECADYVLR